MLHPEVRVSPINWINGNVGGQNEASFEFVSNTLMNGDGVGGNTVANGNFSAAPYSVVYSNPGAPIASGTWNYLKFWNTQVNGTTEAPVGSAKHLEGANYAYVDGHVKWQKPTAISDVAATSSVSTFQVK